ncbi:ABC transporter substrate-binding protein [Bosea sp. 117]|uniref:ABC transporter substrate-binding protein n=1 Tax=Bosea sp. 117 TaxID=1125973 RepID=UPI000B1D4479|nr:ABC transporter substrate-binding protein [Bosea sp. 117]
MNIRICTKLMAGLAIAALTATSSLAQGTLRVAMTLADIPLTDGAPDQGTEGVRFSGYTLYDPLISYDLSRSDTAAKLRPALATEWHPLDDDKTKWVFKLRQGVKFHDGSDFNADAVIFNLDRAFNKEFPAYDASFERQLKIYLPSLKSWRKIDDYTVELTTKGPDSLFPYQMPRLLIASPAQYEKLGKNWDAFREHPSGTGPWKMAELVPRQRLELLPNKEYWDPARVPKLDRLVLLPIPEVSARTAALLSGRVDWAESPSPDTVEKLKGAGMTISTNAIPHVWPYTLSELPDSPFADIRVRKALNLAIDREGLVKVLNGLAVPAVGNVSPQSPWFGQPSFKVRYDPDEARKLLAEAGYGPGKPLKIKAMISTSGSGQMYPLLMNEFVQENLREIGVELELEVFEWEALRGRRRVGAQAPENKGITMLNNSYSTNDPYVAVLRYLTPEEIPPKGSNWGSIRDEEIERLAKEIRSEFDPKKQDELVAKIHQRHVDMANFVWVVHDVGSRALSPKVKGHVHAQSWFVDFSPISIQP